MSIKPDILFISADRRRRAESYDSHDYDEKGFLYDILFLNHLRIRVSAASYRIMINSTPKLLVFLYCDHTRKNTTLLRSLGFAHDPSTRNDWSPGAHIKWVERAGSTKGASPADPQVHRLALISGFIDAIFTDYVDLSFSQANQTARRVITPTNPALSVPATSIETSVMQVAEAALEHELSRSENHPPPTKDTRVTGAFLGADLRRMRFGSGGARFDTELQERFRDTSQLDNPKTLTRCRDLI